MTPIKSDGFLVDSSAQIGTGVLLRGSGKIGANVRIGDYTVIEGHVEIGDDTQIGHHSVVNGRTFIGRENRFSAFCSIGTAPQHAGHDPLHLAGSVSIGDGNVFREYTAVYMPATSDSTSVGHHCYVMAHSHIDHDAQIGDHVKISSGCAISGYVRVDCGAYIGLHVAIHQRLHIGSYAMVGMNTPVTKNVLPYSTIIQQSFVKVNERGLALNGFSGEEVSHIVMAYQEMSADPKADGWRLRLAQYPILRPIDVFLSAHAGYCYLPRA